MCPFHPAWYIRGPIFFHATIQDEGTFLPTCTTVCTRPSSIILSLTNVSCALTPVTFWQIVAVDAGHLKGDWKWVMMTLIYQDSNNKIVHVAKSVTGKEDTESYWFLLRQSMRNAEMAAFFDSPATTLYSDGNRCLGAAFKIIVPRAQQRTCGKHIMNNLGQPVGSVSAFESTLFGRTCSCAWLAVR